MHTAGPTQTIVQVIGLFLQCRITALAFTPPVLCHLPGSTLNSSHLQIFAPHASLTFFSHRFWEVKFSARKNVFPVRNLTKTNICDQYIERNMERHPLCRLIVWPGALDGWMILMGSKLWFISGSPNIFALHIFKRLWVLKHCPVSNIGISCRCLAALMLNPLK